MIMCFCKQSWEMNNKHRKTLKAIFAKPTNGNIDWTEIEALLMAIGCKVSEKGGSGVTFVKDDLAIKIHRPHPQKHSLRYRVEIVKNFPCQPGVKP
jgi:hypothetical protein